jgi:preprotein translocase subunit YajC
MGQGFVDFLSQYGILILMFVGIVLLMIIPQIRRKKQMQALMESMVPGKMVKTIGGMYGKIVAVKEDLVTIEAMPDKIRLMFTKGAIATVEDSEVEENTLEKK